MSTSIHIACEGTEQLFEDHPHLRFDEVAAGSSIAAELLFPQLRLEHYTGPDGGVFADLRDTLGIFPPFIALLEQDEARIEGRIFLSEIDALRVALGAQRVRIPPIFEVADADGHAFSQLDRDGIRVECGYNHCILFSAETGQVVDLRAQTQIELAGQRLAVIRREVHEALDPDLSRIIRIAATAIRFDCRIEIRVA